MRKSNGGYALLSVIAIVTALLITGTATISLVRQQLHFTADQTAAQTAYYIAEAGIQRGIAQLDNDAATAATAAYVYPTIDTTTFSSGTYAVAIAQDPLFPGNYARKQILSTGTFQGQQATLLAHVFVQPPQGDCENLVVWANRDAYLDMSSAALDMMFKGDVFANRDVHFVSALTALPVTGGNSHVYAVRDFYSDSIAVTASPRLSAQLFYGEDYNHGLDLAHLTGFHFSNGANGHGAGSPAPAVQFMPAPDWHSAKNHSRVVIVSPATYSSVAAGSSWSGGAGGTWSPGTFTLADNTRYYVDGNVDVHSGQVLQLGGGSSAEIWARGSINIDSFTVLSALSTQTLVLVAQGDVRIGPTGLVGLRNRTNIFAYSYAGQAEVDTAVSVANDTHACIVAGGTAGDSTYKMLVGAVSGLKPLY